ncbi:MAG: zinc-binding dehydrogenase, partial [Schwartzia sp.]|nr:zinc-binding dehydrogenase [Schwartzia sp. (in: firmicutes)]
YGYLGSRQNGGFAEYVAVPVANLIALPEAVSFEEAALLEPLAVAVHAMRRVGVHAGDTVAVCGLGTIGRLLTMVLYASGVKRLLLIGNKDSQRQFSKTIDGAVFFDMRESGARERLLQDCRDLGVDTYFECVGKNETVTLGIECVAPGGRVVLVGNPASDMMLEKDVYWQILRKQLFLTGTWNSSFTGEDGDDWHEAVRLLEAKKIDPTQIISHRLPLEALERGLRIMRDKTEDFGKIMAVMG